MGETRIHLKIYGANDQASDFEAIVDTGATFSKIPNSVAARLGVEAKCETDVELGDGRDWDKITGRRASIEKPRKLLGYEPKIEMKEGIKRRYDWIVENRDKIEPSARF